MSRTLNCGIWRDLKHSPDEASHIQPCQPHRHRQPRQAESKINDSLVLPFRQTCLSREKLLQETARINSKQLNLACASICPHTYPSVVHVKHHSEASEKGLSQHPHIFHSACHPVLPHPHPSFHHASHAISRAICELSEAESATRGSVKRIRRGAFAVHAGKVPATNFKHNVDVVEAREREEGIVWRRQSFGAAYGFVEPLGCHWWCEDEWNVDVEENRLILEHLGRRAASVSRSSGWRWRLEILSIPLLHSPIRQPSTLSTIPPHLAHRSI